MLLIDVGNSRIKWARGANRPGPLEYFACAYQPQGLDACLQGAFSNMDKQKVWVSCVADKNIREQLTDWFVMQWSVEPVFVETGRRFMGVSNAYEDARALGVDRWLAMVAAHHLYRQALCVIDCGTAVTVDVVDRQGEHQGGLIMPGLQLMSSSLLMGTAGIGDMTPGEKPVLLARDTKEAVNSGCRLLLARGLVSVFEQLEAEMGQSLLCVLTGGDGEALVEEFSHCDYRGDLVLWGLQLIASGQS